MEGGGVGGEGEGRLEGGGGGGMEAEGRTIKRLQHVESKVRGGEGIGGSTCPCSSSRMNQFPMWEALTRPHMPQVPAAFLLDMGT